MFLNAILVAGVTALSIPLIIHLLHRSRYRVVRWGAMHLLAFRERHQKRRLEIQHLLLLLIRCAIPALIALCMARPVMTGVRSLLGAAKTSTVIALDNSDSMNVGNTFTQAREFAQKIVDRLPRGSEAAVVLMGGRPAPLLDQPTFDTSRVSYELSRQQAGFGAANVPVSLDLAAGILKKMHEAHREMIVISDFQRTSWSNTNAPAMPPAATFVHLGREEKNNVSVESLDLSRSLIGVGQKLQVRAHLRNHGDAVYRDLRVYFRVDGVERAASQISLGASEAGQVLFTHAFDAPGSHVIAVTVDVADALNSDNTFLASVPVEDCLPVLLVDGAPSNEPLRGATDFLEIALAPSPASLVATRTSNQADNVASNRVVVLANVAQLSDEHVRSLTEFVRRGGGLLIFPGNRINTVWWNSRGKALLPVPFTALSDDPTSISVQHFEHPALELFNDPRNGDLSAAGIQHWFKFAEAPTNTFVLARLATGDPFLVEKRLGDGSIICASVPADAEWSNLPTRPFYLPLMQQLVTYLASKATPPRNVEIGQSLVAVVPDDKPVELTDPAGERHRLKPESRLVRYDDTRRPGLYTLDTPIHFVVNTARSESDLEQLTPPQIESFAKTFGANVVTSWDEYRQLDQRRRYGREFWRPLLWLVIALIFVELWLEQKLGRSRAK